MIDLLIILTIGMLAVLGYSWFKNRTAEVVNTQATVLRKRFSFPDIYFVTFGVPGGEKELAVGREVYLANDEGQRGDLVYQGEVFREFVPEPAADPQRPTGPPKPPPQPLNPDYHEP